MPPLKVFNLGQLGVNVRESPLHLNDGELVHAQNAELSKDGAEDGLVKRGGMELHGSAEFAGAAVGIVSVPLPDLFPTFARLITMDRAESRQARVSTSGATWDFLAGPSPPSRIENVMPSVISLPFFNDRIYYPINDCDEMQTFDGVGVTSVTPLPQTWPVISGFDPYVIILAMNVVARDGYIWWLLRYGTSPSGGPTAGMEVCLRHDPEAGTFTQVAEVFAPEKYVTPSLPGVNGLVVAIDVWNDSIYVQVYALPALFVAPEVKVYRAGVGDATWTLEDTLTSATLGNGGEPRGIVAGDDALYCGTRGQSAAVLRKRDSSGTWTTVLTVTASGAAIFPVHALGDRVLAWVADNVDLRLKESLDGGGSWSDVYTVAGVWGGTGFFSRLVRFKGLEFLSYPDQTSSFAEAKVIRNNSGWGVVDSYEVSNSAGLLSGVLV